jgi:SAM-dependent methyltransferase
VQNLPCYQCAACGTPVDQSDQTTEKCRVCLSECPSVADVEVRVVQAAAKLRATVDAYRRHCHNLNYASGQWEWLRSSSSNHARRCQAERAISAQRALLALSNDVRGPIERCLETLPAPHWLDDVLSLDGSNAWDIDHMLPYFYQDWHGTGDFPMMRDRIRAAVARHAIAATKFLVVGAGACGLVRDLALSGFEVHAVDLSLPCLVLASRLLRGDTLQVAIPHKFERTWRHAMLPGAAPFITTPRVSVANAARLPFQDGSFPVVLTQYLIDIATNPTQIIVEIGRVLEEGGLWVNLGLPFGLSSEPVELGPICDEALDQVLRELGFELISLERHSCRLAETGALFDWPEVTTQWPQLSVARRERADRREMPDVFQRYRAGTSDSIWNCKYRRLPGRLLRGGPGSAVVSDASAAVVRWIGTQADGRTTLATLRSAARSVDSRMTDLDLVEVVRHLCDEGMLALVTNRE